MMHVSWSFSGVADGRDVLSARLFVLVVGLLTGRPARDSARDFPRDSSLDLPRDLPRDFPRDCDDRCLARDVLFSVLVVELATRAGRPLRDDLDLLPRCWRRCLTPALELERGFVGVRRDVRSVCSR